MHDATAQPPLSSLPLSSPWYWPWLPLARRRTPVSGRAWCYCSAPLPSPSPKFSVTLTLTSSGPSSYSCLRSCMMLLLSPPPLLLSSPWHWPWLPLARRRTPVSGRAWCYCSELSSSSSPADVPASVSVTRPLLNTTKHSKIHTRTLDSISVLKLVVLSTYCTFGNNILMNDVKYFEYIKLKQNTGNNLLTFVSVQKIIDERLPRMHNNVDRHRINKLLTCYECLYTTFDGDSP